MVICFDKGENQRFKSNRLITPVMNKWLGAIFVLLALLAVAQALPVFENKSTHVEMQERNGEIRKPRAP